MKDLWIVDWGVENPVITKTKEQAKAIVEDWAKNRYNATIDWFEADIPGESENFHAHFYGIDAEYNNERNSVGCVSATEYWEDYGVSES